MTDKDITTAGGEGKASPEQPWKKTPPGQFAMWMRPENRPAYEHTPFRHWVVVTGSCQHHGINWLRQEIGEAVIRRDDDSECYQGYRREDIEAIEKKGDMDPGTGIVSFWIPWGNFHPVPEQ